MTYQSQKNALDEHAERLAASLDRDKAQVLDDLALIAHYRQNPIEAVNAFFVKGEGWLYDPLVRYQEDVVRRWFGGGARVCEILPRGHCKTLLGARISPILYTMLGFRAAPLYAVSFSLGQDNYEGNRDAFETVANSEQFADLQWLANYIHGKDIATVKDGNEVWFGNGTLFDFRSILGETRGMNRPDLGRPNLIIGDDLESSESLDSQTLRRKVIKRYVSMIKPMQGTDTAGRDTAFRFNGTVTHREGLMGMIARGKLSGYIVTPEADRKIETDGNYLWPELWNEAKFAAEKQEAIELGEFRLIKYEYYNDTATEDTHPLAGFTLPLYEKSRILPMMMHRVVSMDYAHQGGDDTAIIELGMDTAGKIFVLTLKKSNIWDIGQKRAQLASVIRRRRPVTVPIEDNTDSRSFIDTWVDEYAPANGVMANVLRVSASGRGSKEAHIVSYVQPYLEAGLIHCPEGENWHQIIEQECGNFDITVKNNTDNVIDVLALAIKHLKRPSKADIANAMPQDDSVYAQVYRDVYGPQQTTIQGDW